MRYCGREFTEAEIEIIRELLAQSPPLNRYRLSQAVCERLNWRRANGQLKDMSARVALLRMQADRAHHAAAAEKSKTRHVQGASAHRARGAAT
jgi:hypothetical protein